MHSLSLGAKIFYILIFSFAFGVVCASFFSFGISSGMFFALLGALTAFFSRASGKKSLALVAIGVLSFGLGVARMSVSQIRDYSLDAFVGEKIVIEGVIDDERDMRENSALLVLRPDATGEENFSSSPLPPNSFHEFGRAPTQSRQKNILPLSQEKILLATDRLTHIQYGDRVRAEGKLTRPENFMTENNREFDYVSYLAKDGIHYQIAFPKITLIAHGEVNVVKEKLFAIKHSFLESVNHSVPEPSAGLLGGLLLGEKHALSKDLLEDFRIVGLVHIVILSGYNITLVVDWTMRLLAFLPRLSGLALGSAFTFLFVLMTGANAATVRAGLMAIIVLSARHMGREAESVRLLFFVALLMILWNPHALLSDPSFQLSVAATLGLLVFSPKISKYITKIPAPLPEGGSPKGWGEGEKVGNIFRTIASDTIATQIAVLPLLLWMTGTFSLYALPANLLALPAVPFAMFFGFFTGLLGLANSFFAHSLAFPFAAIAHILLSYIFLSAEFFAELPFAVFAFPI